tara:strand:- start:298 stop:564 length:267 start_codon:yes stop_codon:yes gene_type:complete
MNIKQILNDALNKALITDRIKGVPSSNKIADFVNKYAERYHEIQLKLLGFHNVSNRRELFIEKQGDWLMVNTSLSVEKIVDFKEAFKQ